MLHTSETSAASFREPTPSMAAFFGGVEQLSGREREVLELVASGCSNQEIAETLYVSINSVKTYIRTAYQKIGAKSRSQAVVWAITHGLLTIPGVTVIIDEPVGSAAA